MFNLRIKVALNIIVLLSSLLSGQQSISISGRLEKSHFDRTDSKCNTVLLLNTPTHIYKLKDDKEFSKYNNGDIIKIFGELTGDVIKPISIALNESLQKSSSLKNINAESTKDTIKTVIIPFYFSDGLVSQGDKIELLDKLFNEELTNKYFQTVSYDKVSFTRKSYNPVLINKPSYNDLLTNDDLKYLIEINQIDIKKYNRIILVTWNTYPFKGLATGSYIDEDNNSYPTIYISQPFQVLDPQSISLILNTTLTHELGHTLGCYHAGGYNIETGKFTNTYGNWFDMMGGRHCGLDFNSFFKERMQWLDSTSIQKINTTGIYKIKWLGSKSGIRGAKIYDQFTKSYDVYIEYRKAKGVDSILASIPPSGSFPLLTKYFQNTQGIMVNVLPDFTGTSYDADTYLLDLAPRDSVENNWDVVTLNGNNTYNIGKGITLGPIISYDDSTITFNVKIDEIKIEDGLIAHYPLTSNVKDTLGISSPFATLNTSFDATGGLYCNGKKPKTVLVYANDPFDPDTIASYAQSPIMKSDFFSNYAVSLKFKCEETSKRTIIYGMHPLYEFGVCINEQDLISITWWKELWIANQWVDTIFSVVTNLKIEKGKWYELMLTHNKSNKNAKLFVNGKLLIDQIIEPHNWPSFEMWDNVIGIHPGLLMNKNNYLPFQGWIENFKLYSSPSITDIQELGGSVPYNFSLFQNYPNPFNPTTKIKYTIPKTSFVTLKIYDLLGKEIQNLVNEEKQSGNYEVLFDGSKLASGVYFYRMQADNFIQTKKIILIK